MPIGFDSNVGAVLVGVSLALVGLMIRDHFELVSLKKQMADLSDTVKLLLARIA